MIDYSDNYVEFTTDTTAPDGRLASLSARTRYHMLTVDLINSGPDHATYHVTGYYDTAVVRYWVDPAGNPRLQVALPNVGVSNFGFDAQGQLFLISTTVASCSGSVDHMPTPLRDVGPCHIFSVSLPPLKISYFFRTRTE